MTARLDALQAWLGRRGEPAYVVLDAARDPIVYATLVVRRFGHECLFEGLRAGVLCDVAPYLVPLPSGSPLLARMAGEWWGRSFGILVTSRARPADVLARLRSLIDVRTDDGSTRLFRFYDPRLLRTFLPIAYPRQIATFFGEGEIGAYACEAVEPGAMHVYTESEVGTLGRETVRLGGEGRGVGHGGIAV
jgi:hypothetical protein